MAKDETSVVDEDTLFGDESDEDSIGGEIQTSPEDAIPDLDILGEDVAAKVPNTDRPGDAERKPAADADEVRLPWDKKKQQTDLTLAKVTRRLSQAEHVIEELRAKTTPPSDDDIALTDAMKALESFPDAPEFPGDFDDDDEKEAYKKAMTKRDAELKRLALEVKTLTAKVRTAKPAEKPAAESDDDEEQGPMQETFETLCLDAEVEFGSEHGNKARPLIVRELVKLGFSEAKPATKDQLAKIVTRVYRNMAEPVKTEKDTDTQPRPADGRDTPRQQLPPGRVPSPTWKELGEQLKAKQAQGRRKPR